MRIPRGPAAVMAEFSIITTVCLRWEGIENQDARARRPACLIVCRFAFSKMVCCTASGTMAGVIPFSVFVCENGYIIGIWVGYHIA